MKILWIFLGDHHKIRLYLGVNSMHFWVFYRSMYRMGVFFFWGGGGVAIISIFFFFGGGGVLEIPVFFFVFFFFFFFGGGCTVDAGPEPTYEEKMRVPPPHTHTHTHPGTVA